MSAARPPARAATRDADGGTPAGKLDAEKIEAARQRLKESIAPPPEEDPPAS